MRQIIHLSTHRREELLDITPQVRAAVEASGIRQGLVSVHAQSATAATMIQELTPALLRPFRTYCII
ncbi:MAG: YjbQ family protein [Candidatus Competibacter sp.]|nr:YjbQ family protein [Candidatus Competibacter sp.]